MDTHYGSDGPDKPRRALRPKTATEKKFLALGADAEAFLTGAAGAGVNSLSREVDEILDLVSTHGREPVNAALARAVSFGRWRADDVRSILAAVGAAPTRPLDSLSHVGAG